MDKTDEMSGGDNEEAVRHRAYLIWLAEGQPPDRAEEHWHRATEAIRQEAKMVTGAGTKLTPPTE
jgi:hypothetical protein